MTAVVKRADKGKIGGMQAAYFSSDCALGKAMDEHLVDFTWDTREIRSESARQRSHLPNCPPMLAFVCCLSRLCGTQLHLPSCIVDCSAEPIVAIGVGFDPLIWACSQAEFLELHFATRRIIRPDFVKRYENDGSLDRILYKQYQNLPGRLNWPNQVH